jgi:hypothetical protein
LTHSLKIQITCDECGKNIAIDDPLIEIAYTEATLGDNGPIGATTAVTMHFHDACFDRQSALNKSRIDRLKEPK